MPAGSEQYFVLTLPLKPEIWQQHILEKRFEINRQIYNVLLQKALKRYKQMAQTRAWRANKKALAEETDTAVRKKCLQERDGLVRQYRLSKYDICRDATPFRQHFSAHTDSPVIQNLAADVWRALDSLIRGQASAVREKVPGELQSLSGKTNNSSIKYRNGSLVWKGLVLPAELKNNSYEQKALQEELRFCRLKREMVRGKERYFVQLVLKGRPPEKENTGGQSSFVLGSGNSAEEKSRETVGLKIGFRELAVVSEEKAGLVELPSKDRKLESQKRHLVSYLERSRRKTNPDNYYPDGKIRAGGTEWTFSNKYKKARLRYRELCRKQRVLQREQQFRLAAQIASVAPAGSCFYIEEINFIKLGKRKPNGAGMQCTSPAAFLKILSQKLERQEKELIFVQPFVLKAAGFNHHTGTYQKTPRKKRWRIVDGQRVDKKLYSAFLLSNVAEDLKSFDLDRCSRRFPGFLELQKGCLERQEEVAERRVS